MEKINTFFGRCGNPPNCVWFPNDPHPWATGRAGAATGFIQRVGTDFKGPSSSQTPGLCYSHLFTWSELPGYLQNCGRRTWRESSQVLCYLWNQSVRSLLGMSLPLSIAIRVLFLHNTHIFFVWTGCFHEETSQKMALMPQCAAADGAVLRVALDRNKEAPLGRGSAAGAAAGLNMPTLCLWKDKLLVNHGRF